MNKITKIPEMNNDKLLEIALKRGYQAKIMDNTVVFHVGNGMHIPFNVIKNKGENENELD